MSTPRFANVLKKVPVPLFGTAATAVQFGAKKATSAPRYAQWGVPIAAGGLWFVWPAVDEEWKQSLFQFGSSSDGEVAPKAPKAEDDKDVDEQVEDEATNMSESIDDGIDSSAADKEVAEATKEESAETISSNNEE